MSDENYNDALYNNDALTDLLATAGLSYVPTYVPKDKRVEDPSLPKAETKAKEEPREDKPNELLSSMEDCCVTNNDVEDSIKTIERALTIIKSGLEEGGAAITALETVANLAKISKTADAAISPLLLKANSEFAIRLNDATGKTINVGNVNFKIYTKPARYKFSDAVSELEKSVKKAKDVEKADGTAVKLPGTVDPAKGKIFSATV